MDRLLRRDSLKKASKEALKKIAKANIENNKIRNIALTTSVIAVSIMLIIVLGVGTSYVKNFSEMNTRLKGTNAQGFVWDISPDKGRRLQEIKEIENIGKQYFVGTIESGRAQERVSLTAYDINEWNNNILPTITNFTGVFPSKENGILLSETAIETFRLDGIKIGDKLTLNVKTHDGSIQEEFTVVGTYKDFVKSSLRNIKSISGNVLAASLEAENYTMYPACNCIVSEQLANKLVSEDHIYYTFQIKEAKGIDEIIISELGLQDKGQVMIVDAEGGTSQYAGVFLAVLICLVISLCSYLCIYNIMNISFVNDVHFWGNIKTIGTDNKQLKYIANYETNYFVLRGLPVGLLIGAFVAAKFVPFILRTAVGSGGYADIMPMKMWHSGWLFCLTMGFCYVTVWISFRKSIRFLTRISPVEAIHFNSETDTNRGKQKEQHRCNGKLYKMAWHNITIERKKFLVVVTTLFLGFFVFLLSYTMFSSPNWDLYLDTEAPDDFSIRDSNVTDSLLAGEQGIQYLTEDIYYQLEQMQGITSIEKTYVQPVTVKYSDKLQEYSSNTEDLSGTALGISGEVIQQYALANGAVYSVDDINEFMKGSAVYISAVDSGSCPNLTGNVIQIYSGENTIQTYTIAGTIQPDSKLDIRELGSITNTNYTDQEKIRVFMSEAGIRKLVEEPCIYYIQMNADKDWEPYLKEEIRQMIDENKVQLINRSDLLPTFQPVAQAVVVIGAIFSGILLIVGLMNFINSLCTSIYARQKELAVLSSIGMSKQQMIRLLSLEGGYYAVITFLSLSTIGMGLIYLLMQAVKSQMYYLEFKFPTGILALLFTLLFAVCIITPLLAYKSINKKSIVERLKNSEE